jgi:hypothetical protein
MRKSMTAKINESLQFDSKDYLVTDNEVVIEEIEEAYNEEFS